MAKNVIELEDGQALVSTLPSVTDARELRFLEICLRIYRSNRGSATPTEDFITGLIRSYGVDGRDSLTPDDVDLQEYRDSFEDAIKATKYHMKRYPDLLTEDHGNREMAVS